MVYGVSGRSKEADIVIWDANNYPSLPLEDHSFFFAEAVRAVIEVKSNWTAVEFLDVLEKSKLVKDLRFPREENLADQIDYLAGEVAALKRGADYHGVVRSKHTIGTAAVFLRGGHSFSLSYLKDQLVDILDQIDDVWPEIMLFLEPGKVVLKEYESTGSGGGSGWVEFYTFGEDALLYFTNSLLQRLSQRVVNTEEPFYLTRYAHFEWPSPDEWYEFPLLRPVPHSRHLLGIEDEI